MIVPGYDSLEEDAVLIFNPGSKKEIIRGENKVVVNCPPSDVLVNIYLGKAKQLVVFRNRVEIFCEGFALSR